MLLQSLDLAQKRVRSHAASNISGILSQGGGPSAGQSLSMNVEDVEWRYQYKDVGKVFL